MQKDDAIQKLLEEDEAFYRQDALRLDARQSAQTIDLENVPTPDAPSRVHSMKAPAMPVAVVAILNDDEQAAEPIPFPHRDKPQHFPAFMARSAMFRAGRSQGNPSETPSEIHAQGCSISMSGPRLAMRDKAVWEVALQLAKEASSDMSRPFEVSLREFARRMGETDMGGNGLDSIWQCLKRLCLVRIEFQIRGQCSGVGSMLATATKRDGRCYLRLNPDFALPALAHDKQFRIRSARRNSLSMALAQWMHDFLSTHSTSRDLDLGYLRSLCGYDGPKRNFAAKLRSAMAELATRAPELVAAFEVEQSGRNSDGWKLKVVRGPELPEFTMPKHSTPKKVGRGGVAL